MNVESAAALCGCEFEEENGGEVATVSWEDAEVEEVEEGDPSSLLTELCRAGEREERKEGEEVLPLHWHRRSQVPDGHANRTSHCSPASRMPFPHTGADGAAACSIVQSAEQPSPPIVFPSSHCSPASGRPLPQMSTAVAMSEEDDAGGESPQRHPNPQMPLAHGNPTSHSSPVSRVPLPQADTEVGGDGETGMEEREGAIVAGRGTHRQKLLQYIP